MTVKKWCLVVIAVLLAGCGAKVPPPLPPTQVVLDIQTFGDINPNSEGRPSPLVLRFYELKSLSSFKSADFISLYEKDKGLLGGDLIQKHEFVMQPNDKKTVRLVLQDDTVAIGGFAVFRNYQQARWRTSANVRPHQSSVLEVTAKGNVLEMK